MLVFNNFQVIIPIIDRIANGISATDCLGGTSTCERINNPRFAASILDFAIIKRLPQKDNSVPISGTYREDDQARYKDGLQ